MRVEELPGLPLEVSESGCCFLKAGDVLPVCVLAVTDELREGLHTESSSHHTSIVFMMVTGEEVV